MKYLSPSHYMVCQQSSKYMYSVYLNANHCDSNVIKGVIYLNIHEMDP